MISFLSTKKLQPHQRNLILNAGMSLVEYDAIRIEILKITISDNIQNAIFTSQNAVKSVFRKDISGATASIERCYCVGDRTEALLLENGQNVVEKAKNASELADLIQKKHSNHSFVHFCGNRRRDELSDHLNACGIELKEKEVYQTQLVSRAFQHEWDAILFFSPSGVQSFRSQNDIQNATVFCIGTTTASEAKKHTNNVVVANNTTIESVIAKAVMSFRKKQ